MGGAERSARRKRQQQTTGSKAVASARKSGPNRTKIVIGAVVVVLLAGAVIGGVLYTNAQKNATEGKVIDPRTSASAPAADYPVRRDGAVAVVGEDGAKVTLDVYEDFLCPHCATFEKTYGPAIDEKVRSGEVQVRYHMLTGLNSKSDPPGYSVDSANAGLCAADAGKFPTFAASLFDAQPEEGARGYDKGQLTRLGNDVGINTPDFASCVDSGRYNQQIEANYQQVVNTPHLHQTFPDGSKGFGTPTVAMGEKVIDTADSRWLDNLVNAA